jgi:hypothetical protein
VLPGALWLLLKLRRVRLQLNNGRDRALVAQTSLADREPSRPVRE